MKTLHTLMAVSVLLAAVPRVARAQDPDDVGIPVGSTPAAPKIEDLSRNQVDLAKYVGHGPVLLEFWAQWCPICKELEPTMAAAHAKYGKQVTFIAVGVAVNESPASIQRHLTDHPMPYQVLWDSGGNATRAFQAVATSYVVILNAKGTVVYTGTGSDQDIEAAVRKAIKG